MSHAEPTYKPVASAFSEQLHDEQIEPEDGPAPDVTNPNEADDAHPPPPRFRHKPEIKVAATLVVGLLILLAVMTYLSFLWFGKRSRGVWARIVLSNWAATSVVICAVVVRAVVTAQTSLNTSVLALRVMETGAPLIKIPRLSSMRYSNDGPLELLYLLLSSARTSFSPKLFSLVLVSGLITLLLQFTSTLLVSDLATAFVETFPNSSHIPILAQMEDNDPDITARFYTDALMSTQPTYPLFAELSAAGQKSLDPIVDDTGPSIRALLPLSSEARPKIQSFEGNASLYDARWICVQPNLANLTLVGSFGTLNLAGYVEPSRLVPPMVSWRKTELKEDSYEFNCTILTSGQSDDSWTVLTCPLGLGGSTGGGLIGSLDKAYDASKVQYILNGQKTVGDVDYYTVLPFDPDGDVWSGYADIDQYIGGSYLVINVSNIVVPTDISINQTVPGAWSISFNDTEAWNSTGRNAWTNIQTNQPRLRVNVDPYGNVNGKYQAVDDWTAALDLSICSSAFAYVKSVNIQARRESVSNEPVSMTDGVVQIGASGEPADFKTRGIMQLDEMHVNQQLSDEAKTVLRLNMTESLFPTSKVFNFDDFGTDPVLPSVDRSWFPAILSGSSRVTGVNEARASLFQRVIRDTGSPALAMQAMQHTVVTDRYYKYMPYFKNESDQITTFAEQAIQPVRVVGFIIVTVLLGLHLTLTAVIFAFLGSDLGWLGAIRATGQAWQAYAQVMTLPVESEGILSGAVGRDDQVKETLKRRGVVREVVVLTDSGDGEMRFRRRHDKASSDSS